MSSKRKRESVFTCPVLTETEYDDVVVPFSQMDNPSDGVKAVMAEYGYCIVPDVLTEEETKSVERLMNQDLQELVNEGEIVVVSNSPNDVHRAWSKAKKEGVGSWPSASLNELGNMNFFQLRGLPHSRFAWGCRTAPRVKQVYEVLHGATDLVSSCDNSFVSNRAQETRDSNPLWPHVDLNSRDEVAGKWDVYQGLLYVWSSTSPDSSTTVIWPRSHKQDVYENYVSDPRVQEQFARNKIHFTPILSMKDGAAKDRMMDGWLKNARRVTVPAGGLLLWSSRTTHQGWSGGPRLAQPVCWEPRERRTQEARCRKLALAALGMPSTHWASLGMPHSLVSKAIPKPVKAKPSKDEQQIVFPLKSTIRSQALQEGVDQMELWRQFAGVTLDGKFSPQFKATLESSIRDEFKRVL